MRNLFRRNAQYTDGIVDLVPVDLGETMPSLRFGQVLDWRITLHGRWREIGKISLRSGESEPLYYFGHIGYHIDLPWRGHHYAEHAVRLLYEEIRMQGKKSVVITTDPDNYPSIRTCERLGCVLEREVDVPEDFQRRFALSARKRRYIWQIDREERKEGNADGTHAAWM
ncbi:MAG: GNAT family N-acetyltransferase [Clostridia bacterium]|nr:GNAT family N-acetyltransferase [Clostridia bacterium]